MAMVQKILGKSDIPSKQKGGGGTRVVIGAPAYRRRTIERQGRGFNEIIKTKTKQNKTKVTPEKDAMASANQTPRGYNATCG